MGQEKIFSKSDNSGSKKSSVIEDNFQNFLRNLVPFCKEFMVLTDIFGSSAGGGGALPYKPIREVPFLRV